MNSENHDSDQQLREQLQSKLKDYKAPVEGDFFDRIVSAVDATPPPIVPVPAAKKSKGIYWTLTAVGIGIIGVLIWFFMNDMDPEQHQKSIHPLPKVTSDSTYSNEPAHQLNEEASPIKSAKTSTKATQNVKPALQQNPVKTNSLNGDQDSKTSLDIEETHAMNDDLEPEKEEAQKTERQEEEEEEEKVDMIEVIKEEQLAEIQEEPTQKKYRSVLDSLRQRAKGQEGTIFNDPKPK